LVADTRDETQLIFEGPLILEGPVILGCPVLGVMHVVMLITTQVEMMVVIMMVDVDDLLFIRSARSLYFPLSPRVMTGISTYDLNGVGTLRIHEDSLHCGCCCLRVDLDRFCLFRYDGMGGDESCGSMRAGELFMSSDG
jgi:hypothetical protein